MVDHPAQCLSSAEVVPGQLKRCIRSIYHPVNEFIHHIWVEAGNRSDGIRTIAEWDDQRNVTTTEYIRAPKLNTPETLEQIQETEAS